MPIEFQSVSGLARAMGAVPAKTRTALRPKLREAGDLVANKARENAAWSSRIPGAISVSQSLTTNGGVIVRVNSATAPHARPYEGIGSQGGIFRHPVFGNDWWVPQATRPFLRPAVASEGDKAKALIAEAVKIATRDI